MVQFIDKDFPNKVEAESINDYPFNKMIHSKNNKIDDEMLNQPV